MQTYEKFQTRFNNLPIPHDVTIAEYIWIGGSGIDIRSKTMCISSQNCNKLQDFPTWNFDGSSTDQATTEQSEILLKPIYFCRDPFRADSHNPKNQAFLVLCETLNNDMTPAKGNFREDVRKIFEETTEEKPWFGFEQEYILAKRDKLNGETKPLAFPPGGYAKLPKGQYYCSVGASVSIGRYVAEAHLKCALYAGLTVSGINAEGFPSQWEYQIGPVEGIEACDQLWMSRYILERVCEEFDLDVNSDPKPLEGEWYGSGCHCNFSCESTRKEGGYSKILEAIQNLSEKHKEFIKICGKDSEKRLTGEKETPRADKFEFGVANREASVRVHRTTFNAKKGSFEDRRPSGNCDPYLVGGVITDLTLLQGKYSDNILNNFRN